MLFRVLGQAMRTLRAAGWRACAIAPLFVVALVVVLPAPKMLLFVGMAVHNIATFAAIRQLAASRGLSAKRDVPATLTRGVRGGLPTKLSTKPGPVSDADRAVRRALTSAGQLARAGMRLALVQLAGVLTILSVLLVVGGNRVLPDEQPTQQQVVRIFIGLVPVSALVSAFIALAAQRIAIEGDHRVVLAVAHAVKIARTAYGTVFALCLIEPLVLLAEVLARDSLGLRIFAVVVHPVLRLVVLAALNEVYADGPALLMPPAGHEKA